jgi:hypothetical protein
MAAGAELTRARFLLKLALARGATLRVPPLAPTSTITLQPIADGDPYQLSFWLERPGGPRGQVTIEAHADDEWPSSLCTAGEGGSSDLYEPVPNVGDAAAWASMVHTLRVRSGVRRVTVELDLPFGAELVPGEVELACYAARSALDWR